MVSFSKLLPACGFAIAAALAGVTSAFKEAPKTKSGDTMFTFQYVPPSGTDYSQASVENLSNWQYTSDNTRCSDQQIRACKVYVTQGFVDGTDPGNYTLDPSYEITASSGTTSLVTATSDGLSNTYITNKGNQ